MRVSHGEQYHPLGTEERHVLDGQLQQQRFAALEAERDRAFAHAYTFRPKLTTPRPLPKPPTAQAAEREPEMPHDPAHESLQAAAAKQKGSVFTRLAAKAAEREARQREREEIHRQQQAQRQRSAFQPQVDPRSKALAEKAMKLDTLPVQDRLLQYGRNVSLSHEARRRAAQEKEAAAVGNAAHGRSASMGSQRETDPYRRALSKQAFEARNAALLEQREERQRSAARSDPNAFQPRISSTSALLDAQRRQRMGLAAVEDAAQSLQRRENGAVSPSRHGSEPLASEVTTVTTADPSVARGAWLYADAKRAQEQRALARQAQLEKEEREVFHGRTPQTNPVSDAWIAQGEHQRLFACDFVTRQELYRRAQETERHLQHVAEVEAEATDSLSHSPAKVSSREVEAQVARLYNRARERSQQHHKRLADKVRGDEDCTFAPQLSPGTKHVIRTMHGEREKDVVARLTRPTAQQQPEGEQPSPSRVSGGSARSPSRAASVSADGARDPRGLPSSRSSTAAKLVTPEEADTFYRRQLAQIKSTAYKSEMQRKERATEDLLQCTFRPKTNADRFFEARDSMSRDGSSEATQPPVSGVTAFLQRQAEAKRLRDEKAERERSLGRGRPLSPNHRTTRFQPFKLTADMRIKRLGTHSTATTLSERGGSQQTESEGVQERPFLSNLSTNDATTRMSLPPKRETVSEAGRRETPRSRSALRRASHEDRRNLSVSFVDTSDSQHEDGEGTTLHSAPLHSDPYDIQALMERLRQ